MNNDSANCNFKNLCHNQSTEGPFVNTWTNRNVSKLYNFVMFNSNVNDQYCDFTTYGKGYFCLSGENATNGELQNESSSEAHGSVRCSFISILGYVGTNECWLVYLHGKGIVKNGFYSLLVNNVDGSISLRTHKDPYSGYLTVVFSCILSVVFDNYINVEKITNQLLSSLKR